MIPKQILVLALITLVLGLTVHRELNSKVNITLHYETVCPHSKMFILTSLKQALNTKDFWSICDIHLVPYGGTTETKT